MHRRFTHKCGKHYGNPAWAMNRYVDFLVYNVNKPGSITLQWIGQNSFPRIHSRNNNILFFKKLYYYYYCI